MKIFVTVSALAAVVLFAVLPAGAQDRPGNLPNLGDLSPEDVTQAAIAFLNVSSSPGVDGMVLDVDPPGRRSDLVRSSLGFNAEFSIREQIYEGYWGLALAHGDLEDDIQVTGPDGEALELGLNRDVLSLRGTLGLSFPINERLKIIPYLSLVVAELESDSEIRDLMGLESASIDPLLPVFNSTVRALTTAGTLEAAYSRWFGAYRLELGGLYTAAYSDTFDASNEILDTWSWTQTGVLRSRISGPLDWEYMGRPWRWNAFLNHTNFMDQKKAALGFTYYYEAGLGVDWEWNLKPLDWFGIRYVGIKGGYIFGDDVSGFNVGLTMR